MASIVALAGFMGSGKSTVGRALAERLGWQFVDLDERVVDVAGEQIPAIFDREGEEGFRRWETTALNGLLAQEEMESGLVLALGGGTLTRDRNVSLLRGRAMVVLLDVDEDTAWGRAHGSGRPLARQREGFQKLFDSRRASYVESADVVVDVNNKSVTSIVHALLQMIQPSTGGRG